MRINCYFCCYNHPPPLKLTYCIISYRDHERSNPKISQFDKFEIICFVLWSKTNKSCLGRAQKSFGMAGPPMA